MSILSYIIIKSDRSKIKFILTINLNYKPKSWSWSCFIISSFNKLFSSVMCHVSLLLSKLSQVQEEGILHNLPFFITTNHIFLTLLLNESSHILYFFRFILQMNILKNFNHKTQAYKYILLSFLTSSKRRMI
jgi:hypothetical protein